MKRLWVLGAVITAALLLVAGCAGEKGSDGNTGATGATGATGPTGDSGISNSFAAKTLTVAITGASVSSSGVATMTFTVKDQDGFTYPSVGASNAYFNITQLVPASGGNSSYWQSYSNRTRTTTVAGATYTGTVIGIGASTTQAYAETNSTGTFGTLAYSNGVYTYTFKANLMSTTAPVAVTYDAAKTHRVGIELRGLSSDEGGNLGADAFYDFVPNGAAVTSTRNIVDTTSCNNCHGKLAMHGDGRFQTGYCVQCHNPGTKDPYSDNSLDLKVLIHKVHRGESLPGVQLKTYKYQIRGFSDWDDFSDVVFPVRPTVSIPRKLPGSPTTSQHFPECTKCHVETIATATDAANWKATPTMETCGACHDNVVFAGAVADATWQIEHSGPDQTDNASCASSLCHTPTQIDTDHSVHRNLIAASDTVQFNIVGASYASGASLVRVTFNASNPSDGTYYNVLSPPTATTTTASPFYRNTNLSTTLSPVGSFSGASVNVKVAWGGKEHLNNNNGSATDIARTVSSSVVGSTPSPSLVEAPSGNVCGTAGAQCNFTIDVTVPVTEFEASGTTYAVVIEGHPGYNVDLNEEGKFGESLPTKSVVKYFDRVTGVEATTANKRREVVDAAKCANCHVRLSLHGGNRNFEPRVCATCHNSNQSDGEGRVKISGVVNAGTTPTNLDGKFEETIDLKVMIHGIHAGAQKSLDGLTELHGFRTKGIVINGDFDASHVRFPGVLNDCETCHMSGTYGLPLDENVLPSTVNSNNAGGAPATAAYLVDFTGNPADDVNMTPIAAVCSSCHDSVIQKTHMTTWGANFALVGDTINTLASNTEICEVCHATGDVVGVEMVHKPVWK